MENANVWMYGEHVAVPCIMQIASKEDRILNRVDLGGTAEIDKRRGIRDKIGITFVDPLDTGC